ncbi:MAG: S-layer homology domain-containing protein [Clostridiales bacterium]|jgi:hypothetical protein|nr:S-layer homology domain-containing protein [Clostridiales bacterium]
MSRRFAKVLSLLVIPLFLFTTPTTTYAAASDISGHWAEDTLIKWVSQGWLTGNGEGTFSPNKSVTRAEFVALVNRMKGYKGDADISNFTDVTPDKWYYKDIKAGVDAGYLVGTGPRTIAPDKEITRQEAIAIVSRIEGVSGTDASALSFASDGNSVAGWAQKSVAACINVGYVTGSEGKINPLSNITKAEAIVLLNNVNTKTRSFALAGTFGPTSGKLSASKVNVLASGVNLKNIAVSGDFVIDKAVGNGDVRLEGVDVNGTLLVEGGGLNSIYVFDSTISKIDILKNLCRVLLGKGSAIKNIILRSNNSVIEFKDDSTADNLTISGSDNRITLASTVVIDAIGVQGANTKIETEAGSLIKLLNVDAPTKVVGLGTILVANVSSDLTTDKKPDTVNIKGKGKVEIGTASTPSYATPIPPSGGGGGGSYYPTSTPVPDEEPSPTEEPTPTPDEEASPTPTDIPEEASPTPTPGNTASPTPTPVQIESLQQLVDELEKATSESSIKLQLAAQFYGEVNTASGTAIEIDAGTTSAEILGSESEELEVGIWVKRDDLTLNGIKFNIAESAKAVNKNGYYSAILLEAASGSLNNVSAINNTVTITGTIGNTAGIFVGKTQNAKIVNNKVNATGFEREAVQALLINAYDDSLTITDNDLSAKYGTSSTSSTAPYDAPASSLYINNLVDSATSSAGITITGNELKHNQYNFFINVTPGSATSSALSAFGFGESTTTWSSTTPASLSRVVFDKIKDNVSGTAFAGVKDSVSQNVELYELAGSIIKAVNYKNSTTEGRTATDDSDTDYTFKDTYPTPTRSFRFRSNTPRAITPHVRSRRSKIPQLHLESSYK